MQSIIINKNENFLRCLPPSRCICNRHRQSTCRSKQTTPKEWGTTNRIGLLEPESRFTEWTRPKIRWLALVWTCLFHWLRVCRPRCQWHDSELRQLNNWWAQRRYWITNFPQMDSKSRTIRWQGKDQCWWCKKPWYNWTSEENTCLSWCWPRSRSLWLRWTLWWIWQRVLWNWI